MPRVLWHLYLLRTGDGSLYTGITSDVERRLAEHGGSGSRRSKYLRGRGPLRLEFHRRIGSRALALRVEHRVKRLSRERKEQLVRARPTTRQLLDMLFIRGPGG